MILNRSWQLSAASLVLLSSAAFAGSGVVHLGQAVRLEVTPEGAFYRPTAAPVSAPTDGHTSNVNSGLIWTHTDGGLAWIAYPHSVSLGFHGGEVFAEYDLNNQQAQLFSSFDSNPPTPIFTDSVVGTQNRYVASAEATHTHVSTHVVGGSTMVLSKWGDVSGTPDWTYTFNFAPPDSGGFGSGMGLGISRDGQTIVAADSNLTAATVDIAVFSPASNVPISYTTVNLGQFGTNGNEIRGFDLSADGSTLYFSAAGNPVNAFVFDIATHTVVFTTPINASFDSHAISGDGSVFAFGNFNTMSVFEKVAGVYTNTFTRNIAGQNYCAVIDISDDSKTIAYAYYFYATGLTDQIEALDVPTHTVTMTDVVTATGSLQNLASCVSCSADGQHFAVGLWGDGSGPVAEGRLYARNQNPPIGLVNLNGSVFAIQVSADGQRMAVGSKSVHANISGNGGEVDLFGAATPFTTFCYGNRAVATPCPCGHSGYVGRGCQNSALTFGAQITANGSTSPDTVVLTSAGELPSSLSIFIQGQSTLPNGTVFGDGVRCINANLLRIGVHNAVGGTVSYPQSGDPSITARSAALGDPIMTGTSRYYQCYYRDPNLSFCTGAGFNVSDAVQVAW
jgi:hypothetical protein